MGAIIARGMGAGWGFVGRECYELEMPSTLGKKLWRLYHKHYVGRLPEMLADVLDRCSTGSLNVDWSKLVTEKTPGNYRWCYRFVTTSHHPYMEILYKPSPESDWCRIGQKYLEGAEPNWYIFEAEASTYTVAPAEILERSHAGATTKSTAAISPKGGFEDIAQAIEARAQVRGENAFIWFVFPNGIQELLQRNTSGDGWISLSISDWGVSDIAIPFRSRFEGIQSALSRGALEQRIE